MFTISKEIEFDAGHRVPAHVSKCKNPHGHRYRVRATITGELITTPGASDEGMLADFGDLKKALTEQIHDVLDHGFIVHYKDDAMLYALTGGLWTCGLNRSITDVRTDIARLCDWKVFVFPYVPTAENLALWSFLQLDGTVRRMGFALVKVDVWETPTSVATFTSNDFYLEV